MAPLQAAINTLIAFSGKMGSGKSTLAWHAAQRLAWDRVSFGDYVRTIATARGLEPTGPNLQEVGAFLAENGWEKFCRAVLAQAEWQPGQPLVIDGVRHVPALTHLRQIVAPCRLALVHIHLDEALRVERIKGRSSNCGAPDDRDESHSTERDVKEALLSVADLVVDGARPVEELVVVVVKHFDLLTESSTS